MITIEELQILPVGRVLKRIEKQKWRIVKPLHLKTCEGCGVTDQIKMLKLERSANRTLLVLCFKCGLEEIND